MQRSKSGLFDYLVGAGKYSRRECQAQCLGGLQIDDRLVLGRCLHRQVRRLRPLYPQKRTSSGDSQRVNRMQAAGCNDYVPKPYSPRELLAKIRQYLS
jgi:CheY-like chemotaxis protein